MLCERMKFRDILLALVPPVCWGTGFTIAKPAVSQFSPLLMMALVYGVIAVLLLLTVRQQIRTPWTVLSFIALSGITIQGAMIFIALQQLPASVASLVIQIQVPFAVVLGWLIGGDPFDKRKLAGTLIAALGVVMVVGLPDETPPFVPVLLTMGGAFFWAVGQVLARKLGRDSGIVQLKGLAIAGFPQLVLATLAFERGQIAAIGSADLTDWLALGFVALVGFYLAYAAWYSMLRRFPVDEVAPFVLLMPVVAIITATLLIGERILPSHIIGGSVILFGLAVVSIAPRRPEPSA